MSAWIGSTFTSDVGWSHLETLVDIGNRMAGTAGEQRAAEATRDALTEVGARDATLDPFPIQGWERGSSVVRVAGTEQSCIALPRSPSGRATGRLVDLGHGLPEDFERDLAGTVVMTATDVPDWHERFIHRREKYYHAIEAGAAGFIFRNHVEGCLPPTGSVGTGERPIGEIPAVGVSNEVGERLARRWEGEEVAIEVEASTPDATSHNVHADIGPETDEAILLTSHVDAHDIAEGAGDNGAGTAMLVEVANALATREEELETRVHCIAFGAEEVGLCGSLVESERRNRASIKAIVNNDGGGRARTMRLVTHRFPELTAAADRLADRFDHPVETTPRLGPHSDHWPFVRWGVPGYQVTSVTRDVGRGWGHTAADTLDKIDGRDLRTQSILLADLVTDLARDRIEIGRREPTAIAEQLGEENKEKGMRITGDWPYEG